MKTLALNYGRMAPGVNMLNRSFPWKYRLAIALSGGRAVRRVASTLACAIVLVIQSQAVQAQTSAIVVAEPPRFDEPALGVDGPFPDASVSSVQTRFHSIPFSGMKVPNLKPKSSHLAAVATRQPAPVEVVPNLAASGMVRPVESVVPAQPMDIAGSALDDPLDSMPTSLPTSEPTDRAPAPVDEPPTDMETKSPLPSQFATQIETVAHAVTSPKPSASPQPRREAVVETRAQQASVERPARLSRTREPKPAERIATEAKPNNTVSVLRSPTRQESNDYQGSQLGGIGTSESARHARFEEAAVVRREAVHNPVPGTLSVVKAQPISSSGEPLATPHTITGNPGSMKSSVLDQGTYQQHGHHSVSHSPSWEGYSSDMMVPYTPPWVLTADALFFKREGDEGRGLSAAGRLVDFDFRLGGRIALNRRFDSLDGWEIAYVGPYDWVRESRIAGANLNTSLNGAVNLSAFNNAVFHEQAFVSRLNSVEFNLKQWGWDVLTTSYGTRFINIDEHFVFNSTNAAGEQGRFVAETDNHLFGGQFGMEMKFPLGALTSISKVKGGIFGNFAETNTLLRNNGVIQIDNVGEELDFASIIEVGYYLSYQLGPRLSIRGGYETWWVYGLALAPHQFGNPLSGVTGQRVDINEDLFYHGGSVGIEFVW